MANKEAADKSLTNAGMLELLKASECSDATYPSSNPPLVFERALGSVIYDVEGREYLDFCAGFGALALGHNPPVHDAVLRARLSQPGQVAPKITHGMGDVYASKDKVELVVRLAALVPGLTRAALALTGSQAVEIAVKTALLKTGRSRFAHVEGSYHGVDLGILPLTDRDDFIAPFRGFSVASQSSTLPFMADQSAVAELLAAGDIAAVIVEPIQGRAGVRSVGANWLSMLREQCDRFGTLLIYDEVFTGMGRSGRLSFASEVPCDLLCLGKALGGGYPLSACLGSEAAMSAWPESRGEAIHTGTFFGHPLSCAMALATLDEILALDLAGRAKHLGDSALSWLRSEITSKSGVKEVRGEGLMLALEFFRDGAGALLMDSLRAQGLIALASGARGECLSLTPALSIPEETLFRGLKLIIARIGESLKP